MAHPRSPSSANIQRRAESDPVIGTVIDGDFHVDSLIGVGSHADVFAGHQRSVGDRPVAIKILSRPYLNLREPDFRRASQALLREGELLGMLHASCFVDVYRTGILADERPYLAMEYAEGDTLATLAVEQSPLPVALVIDIGLQAAEGLAELHQLGFVHRDVTPANLIVCRSALGHVRLKNYDFGTVTKMSPRADRYRVGYDPEHPLGTPAYMSPEQAQAGVIDGRSDQFALASVLFELLVGYRPVQVEATGPRAVLDHLRSNGPIPVQPLVASADVPTPVVDAVLKALSRDPGARFDVIDDFAKQLLYVKQKSFADTRRTRTGLIGRLLGP